MFFDCRLQLCFWHCAYYLVYYLSALDEEDRRDTADTIFRGNLRVIVYIEFADVYLA